MYVVLRNASIAEPLSRRVFELSRPQSVRHPDDGTIHRFGWITHPRTGDVAIELESVDRHRVHSDSDPTQISRAVSGELSLVDKTAMEAALTSRKGDTVRLRDEIPFNKLGTVFTREEMKADGWPV